MTQWRLYLVGVLLAAMFAGAMYIAHLQTEMAKAKKAAHDAQVQSEINGTTAQAVDRLLVKEHIVREETINAIREIEALPTGEALVPDDVANAWADSFDRLHNATADAQGDNPR